MKSTLTVDQWWDLVRREKDGEFGPEGLGSDVAWLAENWQIVRSLRLGKPTTTNSAPTSLLQFLGIVDVPATSGQFVVRDHFKLDTSDEAEVKISYLGDNFEEWFLGKTEEQVGGKFTLRIHKLTNVSVDGQIINELGGEAKAEITLAEVFALMKEQGKGEEGALLTSGYANIFYICDINKVLRAVSVYWYGDGWRVSADSVADPYRWDADDHVLSRNS